MQIKITTPEHIEVWKNKVAQAHENVLKRRQKLDDVYIAAWRANRKKSFWGKSEPVSNELPPQDWMYPT
jgi:hypothetical protein